MQVRKLRAASALKILAFVSLLAAMAAPAFGQDLGLPLPEVDVGGTVGGVTGGVPEIDAGSLMSAIAMAGFGAMMIADRIRRK
jgi:hypothetical protein